MGEQPTPPEILQAAQETEQPQQETEPNHGREMTEAEVQAASGFFLELLKDFEGVPLEEIDEEIRELVAEAREEYS